MRRCCNSEKGLRACLYSASRAFLINQLCYSVALERPPGGACLLQDQWRKGMASVSPHAELADFHPPALPAEVSVSSSPRQEMWSSLISKTAFGGISHKSIPGEKNNTSHGILEEWREGVVHLLPRLGSWYQFSSTDHPRPPSLKGNKLVIVPIGMLCLPMIGGFAIALYRCCTNSSKPSAKNKARVDSNQSHHTFLTHTPRALGRRMLLAGVLRHDTPTDLSASIPVEEDDDTGLQDRPVNDDASQPAGHT